MAEIDSQGNVNVSPKEISEGLIHFTDAITDRGGIWTWIRNFFGGNGKQNGPRIKDVLALPVTVTAHEGKLYVRMFLLGAKRKFGKGAFAVFPSIRCALFPYSAIAGQVQPSEIDSIDPLVINEHDPHHRIVFKLPSIAADEICKRVFFNPHSGAALVYGLLEVAVGKKRYEVPIVPLSPSMGNGMLMPHDGPLVPSKDES